MNAKKEKEWEFEFRSIVCWRRRWRNAPTEVVYPSSSSLMISVHRRLTTSRPDGFANAPAYAAVSPRFGPAGGRACFLVFGRATSFRKASTSSRSYPTGSWAARIIWLTSSRRAYPFWSAGTCHRSFLFLSSPEYRSRSRRVKTVGPGRDPRISKLMPLAIRLCLALGAAWADVQPTAVCATSVSK